MKKKCYSLTFLGTNANGGNDYRINSTIWISQLPSDTSPLVPEEMAGFAVYLQSEIHRVWTTFDPANPGLPSNPGLSFGAGPYRYNRTNDTFICSAPTGSPAHPRDTGVVVRDLNLRNSILIDDGDLVQNEIHFLVGRVQPLNIRPYLDEVNQNGILFYHRPAPVPGSYAIAVPPALPIPILYDPVNQVNLINFRMDIHNTVSHEFGHALGLADRYHYLAFGRSQGLNGNRTSDGGAYDNWICRHGGGDVPMYLPGFFDKRCSDYDTGIGEFVENPPPYNIASYPVYLNPDGTTATVPPGSSLPQPDFNPLTADHRGVYDIEYSTLFGWEHNIMSTHFGVNDANGLTNSRFRTKYLSVGLTGDPLYNTIYGPEVGGPWEVVLITQTQTNVITDRGAIKELLPMPDAGSEIISHRTEEELAISHGFPEGMFNQFAFVIAHGNSIANVYTGNPARPENRSAMPGMAGVTDGGPGHPQRQFYNTKSGGTFIGIHYDLNLDKDGKDANGFAQIVTDWEFDNVLAPAFQGVLGVADCMDYRMSDMKSGGVTDNQWEPISWPLSKDPTGGNFLGFINPEVSAIKSPTSQTRSWISGRLNGLNRIKNLELHSSNRNLFRSFPSFFLNAFTNNIATVNNKILAFDSIDSMRFVQRVLEQARAQNRNATYIFDGSFGSDAPPPAAIEKDYTNEDIFAECGIATHDVRQIWNSWRTEFLPTVPNPPVLPGSVIGAVYPLTPTINVTAWATRISGEEVEYEIGFSGAGIVGTELRNRYTFKVRYFGNRNIIKTITLPS